MKNKLGIFVLFIFAPGIFAGCEDCYKTQGWFDKFPTYKEYEVNFTEQTPKGIDVDPTGQDADLEQIDCRTDELEACLDIPIHRGCIGVKIPNDWFVSQCGTGEQLLPIPAPVQGCWNKGATNTAVCGCWWRSEIQDDYIIVVTPNLRLFKAELARIVTGEFNVWSRPEITKCLTDSYDGNGNVPKCVSKIDDNKEGE